MKNGNGKWALIIIVLMAVIIILVVVTPKSAASIPDQKADEYDETPDPEITPTDEDYDAAYQMIFDEIGIDANTRTGGITQEEIDSGAIGKVVESFESLVDAEQSMGYFFGFHAHIKSLDGYELTGMYNIGDGAWYQGVYEDTSEADESEESQDDKGSNLVVKTSKTVNSDNLVLPYGTDFESTEIINIYGTDVKFYSNDDIYRLCQFDVPNGKAYTLFRGQGFDKELYLSVVEELIVNLMSMDDWVDY